MDKLRCITLLLTAGSKRSIAMLMNTTERAHAEAERIFRVILPENGLAVRDEQIVLCHAMLDSLLHNILFAGGCSRNCRGNARDSEMGVD